MPTSIYYPKRTQHGSVTRPARARARPAGVLVAFYDATGRWIGQLSDVSLDAAKKQATARKMRFESVSFQKC